MKIVPFTDIYLPYMVAIFVAEYSDSQRIWSVEAASEYLSRNLKNYPQYCKIVLSDTDEFMGGISCRVDPYYSGKLLFIDSLEIDALYRKQGIATTLLKDIIKQAKNDGINGMHFLGDARKKFPKSWYQKLGFVPSGWIEYEVTFDKLTLGNQKTP